MKITQLHFVQRKRKPKGYKCVIRTGDAKTIKGEKYGYLTGIMYLAPADSAGIEMCAKCKRIIESCECVDPRIYVLNVCPKAGDCKAPCLNTAGRGAFDNVQLARIAKTRFLVTNPELFRACLRYDIAALERKAQRLGLIPCVRVNGTSDLPQLALEMAREFPAVQFYDYTKIPRPWTRTLPNYYLTFSLDGAGNHSDAIESLRHGVNVSVVFNTKRGKPLPATWEGYQVIDGDVSDLRFQDPKNVVVGLRAKGKPKRTPRDSCR